MFLKERAKRSYEEAQKVMAPYPRPTRKSDGIPMAAKKGKQRQFGLIIIDVTM